MWIRDSVPHTIPKNLTVACNLKPLSGEQLQSVRCPVQAFDSVLRDVVLGDAEDVADFDAAAYLGAGPVMCLLEHPEEALEDSWSEEVLTRLGRSPLSY